MPGRYSASELNNHLDWKLKITKGTEMLNIAIVEDQYVQAENLKKMAKGWGKHNNLEVAVSIFKSGEEFLFRFEEIQVPDIILMDIQMGKMSGMDTARELRKKGIESALIFITAVSEHVFEGYEVGAVNYLLKPVEYSNLALNLDKIRDILSKEEKQAIIIGKKKILVQDIFYIEVMGHTIKVFTNSDETTSRQTMVSILEQLDESRFYRCHKSYVVNIGKIKKINSDSLILDNSVEVPLSRNHRKTINQQFIEHYKGRETV